MKESVLSLRWHMLRLRLVGTFTCLGFVCPIYQDLLHTLEMH